MTSFEVGTDIVSLKRIEAAIDRHGETFLKRIYTPQELQLAKSLKDPIAFYAGRFAAKEAISKALGTGIGKDLAWIDINITKEDSGKPKACLSDQAASAYKSPKIQLSISHEKEYAVAFALVIIS